jgi:ribosomal protein S18 acetylase RimI-like enzyme
MPATKSLSPRSNAISDASPTRECRRWPVGVIVEVVGVKLRLMREDEFADWLPRAREGYADDMVRNAGADPEVARAKAARDSELLFPGGLPSAEQLVFVIEADGERVGELWLAERNGELRRSLYVWNISIDEQHRAHGFGRQAMLLAEEEARRLGLTYIALNVMGGNETARHLYRSLGYIETTVAMEKPVTSQHGE